jgi:hypothetical protein
MQEMTIQKVAELISNGLAIPTILLSLLVVFFWFNPAKSSIKSVVKTSEQWFILGVFIGFLGESLDNIYWTIAWSIQYLSLDIAPLVMEKGVFNNIPFRQVLGIIAAYCHVRSALQFRSEENHIGGLHKILAISIFFGFLFSVALIFTKFGL